MAGRVSLLLLTAGAAGTALVGNAIGLAAATPGTPPPRTRLGVAITDDLGARDQAAVRRSRTLDLREQAMRAAEARMKAAADASTAGPATPPAPGASPAGGAPAASDQYDDLARIYQAMKPASAALVMEQLDLDVQMRVAQKMRERSTAMILGAMSPKGAATLTMALARRRADLPATPATIRQIPPARARVSVVLK